MHHWHLMSLSLVLTVFVQEEEPGGHWDPWPGHHLWPFHLHSQTSQWHQLQASQPDQRVHCNAAHESLQGEQLTGCMLVQRAACVSEQCWPSVVVLVHTDRQSLEALSSHYWRQARVPDHLRQQWRRPVYASYYQWWVLWFYFLLHTLSQLLTNSALKIFSTHCWHSIWEWIMYPLELMKSV